MITIDNYTIFQDSRVPGERLKWKCNTAIFKIYSNNGLNIYCYDTSFIEYANDNLDWLTEEQALEIAQNYFDNICNKDDEDTKDLNLEMVEKQTIIKALKIGKSRKTTADMLGIGERSLYRKLNELGLMDI